MNNDIDWQGIYPALTTKFTSDDALDLKMFSLNLAAQMNAGVHGIILGGSLGEASTLTEQERLVLLKHVVDEVNNQIPVVMNIAEGSTAAAIRCARQAEAQGARGLMLLPPMRYVSDHRETVTFFKAVAAATALPIMIYNNPVDYKTKVTLDMFEELAACDNIHAVKESSRDITNITRMINRFGDRYQISCGVDTLALEALAAGADGWVAGLVCAFPKETVRLYTLVRQQQLEEARKLYRWFMPLLELDIHPKLVQYIKLAEQAVGIGTEHVRAPRMTLVGEERERVLGIIKNAIDTRPSL